LSIEKSNNRHRRLLRLHEDWPNGQRSRARPAQASNEIPPSHR
jgi:hypothetical protein